ncbi:hypothetical protein [uncultured Chryseobacterium sp.]|uniref:hypothetical protein n=1 Tax=uncultured Chryseobacterium sp. TaxID=259322 RepID=UPI0025ED64F1|nr:hypothetical protein [uncultured Chryseobacterium sp.]
MNYNFKKQDWDGTPIYSIISDKEILTNFGSWGWTSNKIQKIIEGVQLSKTKSYGNEYNWSSEDLELFANKKGVLIIDMLAQRAGQKDPNTTTLQISHDDLIKFLKDFKNFVESN